MRTNNIKNVLLITSSYPPEVRSSSHIMRELAEGLKDRGYGVTVVTSYPQHNLADNNKNFYFDRITMEDEIEVLRIKTISPHIANYFLRGISQVILPYFFLYNVKKFIKHRIDVVVVYSPPLPLAVAGRKIRDLYGAKYILNVQDLFPQNAIDLGILKNNMLIRYFEYMEKEAYSQADTIAVHSENNKIYLNERKGVLQDRIRVIHNWIDIEPYSKVMRTGRFRKMFNIENKFIFLFAGVIGPSQGLDLIIKAARKIKDVKDICFLIVGDGMEKKRLLKMAEEYSLENVIFKPFVSKDEYPELVKDADVGLVCLSSMNKTPVIPGKILGYMAASIPVVAFLNKESDGHQIIKDADCGYSEISDSVEKVAATIKKIYNERNRLKEYGENGFSYVQENFERNVCINRLEEIF